MIGTVSNQALSQETPPPLYKETSFQQTPIGEIPQDWEVRELDSLAEIYDSKRIPLSKMERKNKKGHYPYCGANGIIDYINDYIFDGEYILLAEDGGAYGKFENTAYLMGGKFWVNNHAHILKTIEGKASNQFLKTMLDFLDLNFYIVGSTRKKLNQERMREIKIPAPSLPEQRAIVGVLGVVDSAIEYSDRIVAKTERLKRGLMQQLLTRGIGHTETKQTPIGNIPKEWSVVKLGDIATIRYGLGQPPETDENGVPMIRATNIDQGAIIEKDLLKVKRSAIPQSRMAFLQEGDVIVVRSGAYTGDIGYITRKWDGSIAGYDLVVSPSKAINSVYLSYYLLNSKAQTYFSQLKSRSAQPHLNSEQVAGTPIILPSLSEQESIANILSTISTKLQYERQELAVLSRIKRSMMDLLLTGKVRIKVD